MSRPEQTFTEMGFGIESPAAFEQLVNDYLNSQRAKLEVGIKDTTIFEESQLAALKRHSNTAQIEVDYLTVRMENPSELYSQVRGWYDSLVKAEQENLVFDVFINQFIARELELLLAINGLLSQVLDAEQGITWACILAIQISHHQDKVSLQSLKNLGEVFK